MEKKERSMISSVQMDTYIWGEESLGSTAGGS